MQNNFTIRAIAQSVLDELLIFGPDGLAARHIRRLKVDAAPGYPCRLSLRDAAIGEEVFALSYTHQPADSPYRATGPIFIRTNATRAEFAMNEIPEMLRHRLLSLRAYDVDAIMIAATTVQGMDLETAIDKLLNRHAVRCIDIHNAAPGCYNCRVERAD